MDKFIELRVQMTLNELRRKREAREKLAAVEQEIRDNGEWETYDRFVKASYYAREAVR